MDKTVPQAEVLQRVRPLLSSNGQRFRKKTNVLAKRAEGGETIETVTSDGRETTHQAKPGDYLMRNATQAQEMYVVKADYFEERYQFLREAEEGFALYRASGEIDALELSDANLNALGLEAPFQFEAPWGETMVAKTGDYLAVPKGEEEVYRIARREFQETYASVQ